ncbi:MAG: suppressor of fused domain protein [Hamadaea sp.]|uniref:suppressor of fused domain protein n=1 Tax=Hamadaea sp. TaxID=2024425 RepID=UPI0017B9FE51|nr:suppressor of fused domain protein [Hamadaea sp.]NUR69641.1 suppressor of fused domain protein [Hamadaea sp.]NUT23347.1 suppressor of fused domain protein [Hamadaea sp.]
MTDTDLSPGWDAIDAALAPLYPGIEPMHYGTIIKWSLGGDDPLDGVSVYRRDDHWHFVSYGMSELYDKESDDPDVSGWGFEFTFRLGRAADEDTPPVWALNFLQNLARYVFTTGNVFEPGHHINLNGPIAVDQPSTLIRAAVFAEDPELGVIDTPHGTVRFLQIVGITLDEYAAVEVWDATRLLSVLSAYLPKLVTDLSRASLTDNPAVASAIDEGVRRDGSSTGGIFTDVVDWRREGAVTVVRLGANAAPRIGRIMLAQVDHRRGLLVQSAETAVGFRAGEAFAVEERDGLLEIFLAPADAAELARVLQPRAGRYDIVPGLVVEIEKTLIRDPDGEVVEEIG